MSHRQEHRWANTSLTETQFKWIWCWWTCVCFTWARTSSLPAQRATAPKACVFRRLSITAQASNVSLKHFSDVSSACRHLHTHVRHCSMDDGQYGMIFFHCSHFLLPDTLPARPVYCFYCLLAFCSILTLMSRFFSFILEPQRESFFCCYPTPSPRQLDFLCALTCAGYSLTASSLLFLLHLEVNMFPYIQMFAFLDRNEGVSACRLHWPVGLDRFWFTHSGKKLSRSVLLMLSLWLVSTLGHVAVQLKLDPSPATITLFKQSNAPAEIGSNKFTVLHNFPKHTHHSLLHEMNQ